MQEEMTDLDNEIVRKMFADEDEGF